MKDNNKKDNTQALLGTLQTLGGLSAFTGKSASAKAGAVGSTLGSLGNFAIPGLGNVLSPLLGGLGQLIGQKDDESYALQQHYNNMNTINNPYQLKNGGVIGSKDNFKYKGNTHEQGGIDVDTNGLPVSQSNIEVEDGENMVEINVKGNKIKYVFSNSLKI